MDPLNIQHLLKMALQLERAGVKFFNHWSEKADSEELQMFFSMLADEEEEHIREFMKIASECKNSDQGIEMSKKFHKFYKHFSEEVLFNDSEFESITDLNQALEAAKKQEINTQLFYSELRKYIDRSHHPIVDKIIEEEEKHFKKLSILQKELKPQ